MIAARGALDKRYPLRNFLPVNRLLIFIFLNTISRTAALEECAEDSRKGDLCCGPHASNYTVETCNAQCAEYAYFALETGGICSCDHIYTIPASLSENFCDSERLALCEKGSASCTGLFAVFDKVAAQSQPGEVTSADLVHRSKEWSTTGEMSQSIFGDAAHTGRHLVRPQPALQSKAPSWMEPFGFKQETKAEKPATTSLSEQQSPWARRLLSHSGVNYYTTCATSVQACASGYYTCETSTTSGCSATSYSCSPYSCNPYSCNPYNCNPYSCSPYACNCVFTC
ncbi:hypothetical protein CYMTET_18708, partial [Cymbomonas tetramitiformis]